MAHHPSDENLRAFLAGPRSLDPLLHRRIVRHLLAECRSCRERLATMDPRGGGWWGPSPAAAGKEPGRGEVDYDAVLARAEQTFSLFFATGRPVDDPPGALLAELAFAAVLEEPGGLPSHDLRRA
ncbi:MAG TPA: hypothetical protein VGR07_00705, partial [Thermoanaerobaculia bacterium]|nr:hypothetical protein [Thermoanaerobaculia bacterium]